MRRLNIKGQQVLPFLCKDIYKISFLKLLTQYFITMFCIVFYNFYMEYK